MTKPKFRNPEHFEINPMRDWIRKNIPSGPRGVVVEDIDLINNGNEVSDIDLAIRWFGPKRNSDRYGKLALIEIKYIKKPRLNRSKVMTFGLLDKLLRKGDPKKKQYKGFYLLVYDNDDWDNSNFWLNQQPITKQELINFFCGKAQPIPPLKFNLEKGSVLYPIKIH